MSDDSVRARIEAAYRCLPVLSEREGVIPTLVEGMAAAAGPVPERPRFRIKGGNQVKTELLDLQRKAAAVAIALDGLHWFSRLELGAAATRSGVRLDRAALVEAVRQLGVDAGEAANAANVENWRSVNSRATIVARCLAFDYLQLTGKQPTIIVDSYSDTLVATGPYLTLVQAVFAALEITASAERAARNALATPKDTKT